MSSEGDFPLDLDEMLATIASVFAAKGQARDVALLAVATPRVLRIGYDGRYDNHRLILEIPPAVYAQLQLDPYDLADTESDIQNQINRLLTLYEDYHIAEASIVPRVVKLGEWREQALLWVTGKGVTNQGRVRSDNMAAKECDGLLFRSSNEIHLYHALKRLGVSFAPLPVFIRGGESYRRIEPDFLVVKDGIAFVTEVDGDTVHRETAAEADNRTAMLENEGVGVLHVSASECDTPARAEECARRILAVIDKRRNAR